MREDDDTAVRLQAFQFLETQRRTHPHAMPWSVLLRGFDFEGRRVPLVSQQGIFRPAICRLPLTIRTAPVLEGRDRPYEDEVGRTSKSRVCRRTGRSRRSWRSGMRSFGRRDSAR